MPVIAFYGTDDQLVAYTGGGGPRGALLPKPSPSSSPGLNRAPVPAQADAWAARNGCDTTPARHQVNAEVTAAIYPCDIEADVELYTVHGGGHTWPGGDASYAPQALVGNTTLTIDATRIIWDFLRRPPDPRSPPAVAAATVEPVTATRYRPDPAPRRRGRCCIAGNRLGDNDSGDCRDTVH